MTNCMKCGVKLNFSNNFGGICELCYDNILGEKNGGYLVNGDVFV